MRNATTPVAEGFEWIDADAGLALRSIALASSASHVFTTRQLELRGTSELEDKRRLASFLRVADIVWVRQVHGRSIVIVRPGDVFAEPPEADAIVSIDPARAIAVRVADCVPILIADPGGPLVGAVHAGWRGTCANIAGATIEAIARLGVPPGRLVAAIGPSIGPCCYQVDDKVKDAFDREARLGPAWFVPDGTGRWKLDLWTANRDQLIAAGMTPDAVHVAALCTSDWPELFFSYRRDGAGTGRLAASIRTTRRA